MLIDLLRREGHVELYRFGDAGGPTLTLEESLAAVASDTSCEPATAGTAYCVITTESGDREYEVERDTRAQGL